MSDWQPIETAPKDGTSLLLFMPWRGFGRYGLDCRIEVAHWFGEEWFGEETPCVGPTHWMPLPEPPQEKER